MLPAGSRGGASTTIEQSRAEPTRAPASASRRRASANITTADASAHATRAAAHCSVAPMADATLATASATSQARTRGIAHQATPLGPAGPSRPPRAEPASNASLDVRGPTRRHIAEPHDDEARSREHATLDVGRGLVPRLRRGPSRPTDARLVGTEPSTVAEGSVTRPSMQCTEWPSRRRARSPSIVTW